MRTDSAPSKQPDDHVLLCVFVRVQLVFFVSKGATIAVRLSLQPQCLKQGRHLGLHIQVDPELNVKLAFSLTRLVSGVAANSTPLTEQEVGTSSDPVTFLRCRNKV